ncbi:hypothetical protein FJD32_024310 (plasmid) [Shewanella sp. LC6]|uniref:hypothetical protein n=1 Tax=Shewanella TaxID=22 RepID=UPI000B497613|nr:MULTISPECIES: hypothetical protein [Shewanella]MDH0450905.1 hypothetical protein [Shewanella sp. GD04112]QQK62501.1 hypothetical protein FJD32_024310 [Shewanella sp. LC6]TPE56241.1 hypothetical protein FJD33_15155 [Shewanella sp. LC2]BDA63085.1 hypothetical protein NUITMVS1_45480 [Shewanella xiamenensis]
MARRLSYDMTVRKDGDIWTIWGLGVERDGKVFCHLASQTRFRKQRNGEVPIQQNDWVKGTKD